MWISINVVGSELDFTVQVFEKTPTRLPEAMFFRFVPMSAAWKMDKLDRPIDPSVVIAGGNQHMHAVSSFVSCSNATGSFSLKIQQIDSPLVCFGRPTGFPTPTDRAPDFNEGELISGRGFGLIN